jgi:lambda family phage portal protein
MGNAYREANTTAYNSGWDIFNETSADHALDVGDSLITLRRKSQQLVRDNPIVAGFQQAYINLISGVGPTIYVESGSSIQEKQANKVLSDWMEYCDMTGTKSYSQLIEEKVAASFADGDILINHPIDDKRDSIQTVVEYIEAYRVQTPSDYYTNQNIRHGVQYDAFGRIEGYWVKNYDKLSLYASDSVNNYKYYPAKIRNRLVTYLFKAPLANRPSSSRQVPAVTPIISKLKQFDDYYDALVIKMRVAACFATFIVSKSPMASAKLLTTDAEGNAQTDSTSNRRYSKLQPGMIGYLQAGEEVQFASPNTPGDNVDAFIVRTCNLLSMPLRLPYVVSFLDTSEVNYSSWKGANLDTNRMVARWRRDITRDINQDCKTVLTEALLRGYIRGEIDDLTVKVRWPAVGMLDAEKEARGNKIALEAGVTSRERISDEQSVDQEAIDEERLAEALVDVEREAAVLKRKMELEESMGIQFPILGADGKPDKFDPSSETAVENRKEDGNW